jgi:hypothetical protein
MTPEQRTQLEQLSDEQLLALTAYLEARGEPVLGLVGVMFTVVNRVVRKHQGRTVAEVCLWPYQYSCWNARDPQCVQGLELAELLAAGRSFMDRPNGIVLATCLFLSERVLHPSRYHVPDPTGHATHYLNPDALQKLPEWARPELESARIGRHVFYRGVA